ncbi:hypothetical protein NWQ33_03860 [Mycoplasmopsis cynos]|nr:hypothetical protein [Mycoplasmopsis cynos]
MINKLLENLKNNNLKFNYLRSSTLLKIRDENKKIIELLPVFPPFITKHTEENNKTIYKFKRLDNDLVVFYEDEVIWIDYEVIGFWKCVNP